MENNLKLHEYFKCDPNWKEKFKKICIVTLATGIGFPLVAALLAGILSAIKLGALGAILVPISTLIPIAAIAGYFIINTNLRILKPKAGIYKLDFKKACYIGLKAIGGMFLVSLTYTILTTPIYIIASFTGSQTILSTTSFFCGIILAIVQITAIISYAIDLKFKSIISPKRYLLIVKKAPVDFTIMILKLIGIQFVSMLAIALTFITIVGPIIICIYAGYIVSEIEAQYVRNSFQITRKSQ